MKFVLDMCAPIDSNVMYWSQSSSCQLTFFPLEAADVLTFCTKCNTICFAGVFLYDSFDDVITVHVQWQSQMSV